MTKRCIPIVVGIVALMLSGSVYVFGNAVTYNFAGTLVNSYNGNAQVTGQFTLDTSTATISAFDFSTPVGEISSTGTSPTWSAGVFTINGTNPSTTFVNLVFLPGGGLNPPDAFELIFQTSLSSFDVNTFYAGVVTYTGGNAQSNLTCINGCNGYGSTFGPLTAAPEPPGILMITAGMAAIFRIARKKYIVGNVVNR